jgi:hypothetical protein
VIETSELSGHPCIHLTIDQAGRRPEDLFLLRHADILYTLTVTADPRDPALLERVRAATHLQGPYR